MTEKGIFRAAVPSGASTGVHEALELRDKEEGWWVVFLSFSFSFFFWISIHILTFTSWQSIFPKCCTNCTAAGTARE